MWQIGKGMPPPNYPMKIGNRWEYHVDSADTTIPGGSEHVVKDFIHKFGTDVFEVWGKSLDREDYSYSWIEITGTGDVVYRAMGADNIGKTDKLVLWEPNSLLLPGNPAEPGKKWQHVIESHRDDSPDSIFYAFTYFTVESVNDTVVVTAGKFTDCIRVKSEEYDPSKTLFRKGYTWYAPGVGCVKTVYDYPPEKRFKDELVEYKVK